jgi:hypothetical protein
MMASRISNSFRFRDIPPSPFFIAVTVIGYHRTSYYTISVIAAGATPRGFLWGGRFRQIAQNPKRVPVVLGDIAI